MIRLLIVDDRKLVRDGFRAVLCRDRDIQVVGEARDGVEAIEFVQRSQPDVVAMDIMMPRLDGLEATRRICTPHNLARILILSMSWDDDLIARAMRNGASGYVAKTDMLELALAIRTVNDGQRYFSTDVAHFLYRESPQSPLTLKRIRRND